MTFSFNNHGKGIPVTWESLILRTSAVHPRMSTETQEMLKGQRLSDQIIDHSCVGLAFILEPFQTKTAQNSHALWPHTPTQLTSEPS